MFSDPVYGQDFFGREEIIDLLVRRVTALKSGYRQNIAIIGHQQLGKTSVLKHFLHIYRDPQVLLIYTEIKPQALDYFVDQFVRSVLFQFLTQTVSVEPTESLAELIAKAEPLIPKTVAGIREIKDLLRARKAEEAYSKVFELTSVVTRETGKNCVVILDEFHRLGDFGIRSAFSNFGKRIMVQKDTMYLLSSSSFSASSKILAEKLALLFGHFERIYLDVFDFDTASRFISKRLAPVRCDGALNEFLVAFTDGHPFFLETICSRLGEMCLSRNEEAASVRTFSECLLKLFYESQGVLNQFFLKLISPWTTRAPQRSHLFILLAIAKGCNRLKDIALAVNRSQRETSKDLQDLMANELLVKNGVFYRFHNKIFGFWLREVYERKEISLYDAQRKADDFIKRVAEAVQEYEELSRMDLGVRISQLLESFQNDLVEIGEKKRQLPHFTELLSTENTSPAVPAMGARQLIAKGHGRCWLCKILEEKVTEREILQFLDEHKEDRNPHTKVLLTLKGMDENAKLLAKEKRILTLGLSRINLLMDLYGRPPIVRLGLEGTKCHAAGRSGE